MKEPKAIETKLVELENQRISLYNKEQKYLPFNILIPVMVFFVSIFLFGEPQAIIFTTIIFAFASYASYHTKFIEPFHHIKSEVRTSLLFEFMNTYHTEIDYNFYPDKRSAKTIIELSDLISADDYEEEDVIIGKRDNIEFYLSEITLTDDVGDSTNTIFDGMLFKIKIKGKSFPNSKIQSKTGLLSKLFGSSKKNEEYGFWYDTDQPEEFNKELKALFPFIKYLKEKQGDLRIRTKGDEITILMESDMKFLDDPTPQLQDSFINDSYFINMTKQLNSLLFIVESFVNDLEPTEIEEKLELKTLEYVKLKKLSG